MTDCGFVAPGLSEKSSEVVEVFGVRGFELRRFIEHSGGPAKLVVALRPSPFSGMFLPDGVELFRTGPASSGQENQQNHKAHATNYVRPGMESSEGKAKATVTAGETVIA